MLPSVPIQFTEFSAACMSGLAVAQKRQRLKLSSCQGEDCIMLWVVGTKIHCPRVVGLAASAMKP
jgi:hypothetical protein